MQAIAEPEKRLNRVLPGYQFHEYHAIVINATPEAVYAAIKQVDLRGSPIVSGLLALRMLPHVIGRSAYPDKLPALRFEDFTKLGFILLKDVYPEEMVLGLAGQFWKPTARLFRIAPDEFKAFDRRNVCKAVWNLRIEPTGSSRVRLTTTTRIYCPSRRVLILFACYWAVIRPFSGLIRQVMLRLIRRAAEERSPAAGYNSTCMPSRAKKISGDPELPD